MTPSQPKFAFREQNNKETVQGNDLGTALSKAQFDLRESFFVFVFVQDGYSVLVNIFSGETVVMTTTLSTWPWGSWLESCPPLTAR